ncbi:MAG: stage III sporulation protein AF [Tissierellia bacterium]|nr:stage III sporulation protein AF [Tissierellia bacterium]
MGFVDFLTLWVKDIVIVFVLISIIEIIIPNGNMKKYIDMIIGFLIIIVIISPFIKLIHKNFSMDKRILQRTQEQIEFDYDNKLGRTQEEQMERVYVQKLEGEIKELINESTDYEVEKLYIAIYKDEERYGNIKDMEINLREIQEKEEKAKDIIIIDNINEVSIGDKEQSNTSLVKLKDDEIKDIISSNYDIPRENIRIFLNTLGEGELSGEDYR